MAGWSWNLRIDGASDVPLLLQIEREIGAAVRDGRLRPGEALPSTRALARTLGVTRNTVVEAYRELKLQGWITARPGGKTAVALALPAPVASRSAGRTAGYPVPPGLPPRPEVRTRWPLGAGEPDLRLIPAEPLARAIRRALRRGSGALLGYRDPRGAPEYLEAIRGWLGATRGVATERECLLSTRGAQHALDLVARALCRPGDRVAVEALGYSPAWRAFDLAGAARVPLPVDGDGVRIDALEAALAQGPLRAVYVTPHHQYPTTVSLSPARRLALMRLARAHRFAVIEDDYDHEFHYEGRPLTPLAASDQGGNVIYVGTLSKILAPGLRLGFVHAAPELIRVLGELRRANDRQGDAVVEHAIAELVEEGELQRHLRRMREVYRYRRDALVAALGFHLRDWLSFEVPSGGIGLWARVHPSVDDEAWVAAALARGVGLRAGREFSATGERVPGFRLIFSRMDAEELSGAVAALAAARPTVTSS